MSQNRLIKVFERKEGKTRVYANGFVDAFLNDGVVLDASFLLEGKRQLEQTGIKKFYVLTEGTGNYKITEDAKKLSASKEYSAHLAAVAVVVNNAAIALVVDIYNTLNKPVVTTKPFTDREKARKWLLDLMEADQQSASS